MKLFDIDINDNDIISNMINYHQIATTIYKYVRKYCMPGAELVLNKINGHEYHIDYILGSIIIEFNDNDIYLSFNGNLYAIKILDFLTDLYELYNISIKHMQCSKQYDLCSHNAVNSYICSHMPTIYMPNGYVSISTSIFKSVSDFKNLIIQLLTNNVVVKVDTYVTRIFYDEKSMDSVYRLTKFFNVKRHNMFMPQITLYKKNIDNFFRQ